MNDADPRLRALYRLAEVLEGESLERARTAIADRRRALELESAGPSAFDGLPVEDSEPWRPGVQPFRPAPADQVPVRARRPGATGYRIVGTSQRSAR